MKKLIAFLILFNGCSGCCDESGSQWNVNDFNVSIADSFNSPPVDGIIEGDSAQIIITFSPEFVESYSKFSIQLINSAYALSCDDPGSYGLQDRIDEFKITSNMNFNEFDAGESLNDIIRVNNLPITDWLGKSHTWQFYGVETTNLWITQKPSSPVDRKFLIEIKFASGNTISRETDEILWQ